MAFWESDVTNQWSYLKEFEKTEEREIFNALKARPKNFAFDPRFRSRVWDGWEYFYSLSEHRLPTGLIRYAAQLGLDYPEVVTAPCPLAEFAFPEIWNPDPDHAGELITANSYQQAGMETVYAGPAGRRGVFDQLTAAGKSVQIALLCAAMKTLNVTVTVPTVGLLSQLSVDLKVMLRENIGSLGGGKKDFDARVVVAYDGFLKQYMKAPPVKELAKRTPVLISDELQTATVKLYPFYRLCTNAYYRFGFSGSFFKNDPVRVFKTAGFFGPVLSRADDEDLVREGRAVPPVFKFYEYPITTSIRDREYGEFYSSELVLNEGYNNFFAKLLSVYYEEGKSILVMVKRVEHCARIQTALAKLFVESEIYNGKVSPKRREMLKAQFKSGKLPVLVATDQTFGIGQNVPRIEVFANLGGGLSDDKTMQKYGRGLRSFDDKTSIIIIEPYLSGNKWFEKHSKSRLQIAREEYKTGQVYLISTNGLEMKF